MSTGRRSPSRRSRARSAGGPSGSKFVPVLYGASFRNKGIHPLLDAIVDYLPSPADVPPVVGLHPRTGAPETRAASDSEPFSALVFKIMNDPFLGNLAFFRVYSGKAKIGSMIYNSAKDEEERLSRLLEMHANKRKEIKEVYAGDIAAMGSMKNLSTGDTLCLKSRPIVLESIKFPEPVIMATIEPRSKAEHAKLAAALAKFTREDPTLKVAPGPDDGPDPASGAWASSISTSSWTGWSASSASRPTSASPRSPTRRPS